MISVIFNLGGQFALSATTPQSAAPLRSAASLWGNRYYRGRGSGFVDDLFCKFLLFFNTTTQRLFSHPTQ